MTVQDKILQLFLIGFEGMELPQNIKTFTESEGVPGGFIIFQRNYSEPQKLTELNREIHGLGSVRPWIWVDQEGGQIVRFREDAATALSPMGLCATGDMNSAVLAGEFIGRDLEILGFDGTFAPVCDVNTDALNPVIGIRAFSERPDVVAEWADAFIKGLSRCKIYNSCKHFPGHGSVSVDSHLALPECSFNREELERTALPPFRKMIDSGIDSVMAGHLKFPHISDEVTTFSKYFLNDLLRKELGFKGVLFSDCMEMKAVRDMYSAEETVLKAVNAGVDVFIVSRSFDYFHELYSAYKDLYKRGLIREERINESYERVIKLKNKNKIFQNREVYGSVKQELRKNFAAEQDMADKAVTILKDSDKRIPFKTEERILFVEWVRETVSSQVEEKTEKSITESILTEEFSDRSLYIRTSISGSPDKKIIDRAGEYDRVVALLYSRTGDLKAKQEREVTELINQGTDITCLFLEGPYHRELIDISSASLVTYGFRKVNISAAAGILSGRVGALNPAFLANNKYK